MHEGLRYYIELAGALVLNRLRQLLVHVVMKQQIFQVVRCVEVHATNKWCQLPSVFECASAVRHMKA